MYIYIFRERERVGSSVNIVSDHWLDDRTMEVRSPAEAKGFPLASVSRPALGLTQPPVQWVPGVLSPELKRGRGRHADHSPPSSAEIDNE
jgi:methylaspartate ammonia-lyase